MRRRVHRLEPAVDGDVGQARQRCGELPEGGRHAELPAQRVREYQAVQQSPPVVVLVGGLVEGGVEGRACEQGERVAQAAEDQVVAASGRATVRSRPAIRRYASGGTQKPD